MLCFKVNLILILQFEIDCNWWDIILDCNWSCTMYYPWQPSRNRMFTPPLPIKVYTSLNDSQKTFKCCFFVNTPLYIFLLNSISFTFNITQYTGHVNQNMYNFPFFLVWFCFNLKDSGTNNFSIFSMCCIFHSSTH